MQLSLGKREAQPSPKDFKLAEVAPELPKTPSLFGFGTLYGDWGMLGNAQYGDCVFAGAGHETMLWNRVLHGKQVDFTDRGVLEDYGAVTGFDPNTGANDNGTWVKDAMGFRRTTGVQDATGTRHKIDAYVSIDPKDWETMIRAVYVFGAVGIGFEFPSSAMSEFHAGLPWDVVNGAQIEGGHYVPIVGSLHSDREASAITWGKRQRLTREFYEKYNDEAWVPLSLEVLRNGIGLRHLDEAKLRSMLSAL